jgi:hypothetical protein
MQCHFKKHHYSVLVLHWHLKFSKSNFWNGCTNNTVRKITCKNQTSWQTGSDLVFTCMDRNYLGFKRNILIPLKPIFWKWFCLALLTAPVCSDNQIQKAIIMFRKWTLSYWVMWLLSRWMSDPVHSLDVLCCHLNTTSVLRDLHVPTYSHL